MDDVLHSVRELGQCARRASAQLATLSGAQRTDALRRIAAMLRRRAIDLLAANAADLDAARQAGLAAPLIKRLQLTDQRIAAMADGVDQIAAQVDPIGQIVQGYVRPDGLRIQKLRVPIGVVLFFYESRPNVTSDAAALCLKSGNAIILRGGKEAFESNQAIVAIIAESLKESGIDPAAVQVVQSTDRALVPHLLKLNHYIDLVIPRGGESLIRTVVEHATMPVLKHFTGNCHIYVDASAVAIADQVVDVCVNAKTSYPGGAVCNAVEHLLFHRDAAALLPRVCQRLADNSVVIRGDDATRTLYPAAKPATDQDWDQEYLALIVGVKVVDSIGQAIAHINEHSSHHTDAILATDVRAIDQFVQQIDSASVMVNASTRLADGGVYGLGAEIGISTDKLHARGPMGAADLTTTKWIVTGHGHLRQ
jgi:glutamate-5-semialdehyde dehydrogenase